MTAKQYLRQLPQLNNRIKILSEEIEERRTRLTSTAAPSLGDKVQSSPKADAFATAMAILADKDLQRQELIWIYETKRDEIVDQILGLDNITQQRVLYERYVRGKRWETIADELFYSLQHIYRVHGAALLAFAAKYRDAIE